MSLKIGSTSSGFQALAPSGQRESQPASPRVKHSGADSGDRMSRLPRKESAPNATPNFGAWSPSQRPGHQKPLQEKQLRLREGMLLSDGSRGSKVKGLQYMLNKHGEELRKDGIFGPKTLASVRKLQREHGLNVDGIVGPETLKALNSLPESKSKPNSAVPPRPQARPEPPPQPKPEPKPQAAPEPQPQAHPEAPARPEFGLSPRTLALLRKSGKLEVLRHLPPEVSGRYEQLSSKVKQTMFQQLSGSTWGNSHREAFVNGTVMGMDTFAYMTDQLQAQVKEGKISGREANEMKGDLQKLKRLSPRQRDAVAEMILLQQGK